jgi:hypothetical protein
VQDKRADDKASTTEDGTPRAARSDLEYVLPLRWMDDGGRDELTVYLQRLARVVPVTVVDGSAARLFAAHAAAWGGFCRHIAPMAAAGRNGKVAGVLTGLHAVEAECVIIADDDVRYDEAQLRSMRRMLDAAELVRPQNIFRPTPWHARWDTGRTLINRAFGADYPGTFGLRRSFIIELGGYDADVLFENLELIRTVRAGGGRQVVASGLYVTRLPPTVRHFWSQRIRQAYDSWAQPFRLVVEALLLPLVVVLMIGRRWRALAVLALTVIAFAERGRRTDGGAREYPPTAALWAPVWLAERAICVWPAIVSRARGGVRYAGSRIPTAAHPMGVLRARVRAARCRLSGSR